MKVPIVGLKADLRVDILTELSRSLYPESLLVFGVDLRGKEAGVGLFHDVSSTQYSTVIPRLTSDPANEFFG